MLEDGEKGAVLQRDKCTYAVVPHVPCGVITPDLLRKLADVAERFGVATVKITSAERIALIGLREDQIDAVWEALEMDPGAAVGNCVRSIRACPGTTHCRRAQQDALTLGLTLDEKYHGVELPGKFKIAVSGCPNQCAESQVRDIGLVGMPKGWRVYVGGCAGSRPRLADLLTQNVSDDDILSVIDRIVEAYKRLSKPRQRIGRLIDDIGIDAFRKEALGDDPAS
jgi:NAD(P)H-nitrite reductase large subunit